MTTALMSARASSASTSVQRLEAVTVPGAVQPRGVMIPAGDDIDAHLRLLAPARAIGIDMPMRKSENAHIDRHQ